jgi:transposase
VARVFQVSMMNSQHGAVHGPVVALDRGVSVQGEKEIQALALLGESTQHVRTGINATCVYIDTEEARVVLFFTGRHHAGEIIDRILEHRRARTNKLVSLTDAASKNFSHDHAEELEQAVCNAHCYLKFRAVKDQFPAEYAVAGEVYKKVFDNDDQAKALGLGPDQRMLYHREHSKPQMSRLWGMCQGEDRPKPRRA